MHQIRACSAKAKLRRATSLSRHTLGPWWLLLSVWGLLGMPQTGYAALQKTPQTTAIVILDMAQERAIAQQDLATGDEVYLCILSIQGIVNQQSHTKIYLVNGANGWTDNSYGFKGHEDLDSWALAQGMLPCKHSQPTLDTTKRYPALSYLVEKYRRYIKGKILIPSVHTLNTGQDGPYRLPYDPLFPTDNAIAAAATCAGQTASMICSPAIDNYLTQVEGYRGERVIDCTSLTSQEAAFDWTMKNYFNGATNRTSVRFLRNGIKPEMFNSLDYFIATKSFVTTADAHFQTTRFLDLMGRYPQGTVCFVNYEYPAEMAQVNRAGYGDAIITGCNLSVFSGFPPQSIAASIKPPTAANSRSPQDAYIGFYVTDGDSMFFSNCWHLLTKTGGTAVGAVPIGWSCNPLLLDLKPTLLQWEAAHTYHDAFETVADMLDGDTPETAAGTVASAANLKNYLRASGGLFQTVNFLDESSYDKSACQLATPYFALLGYSGNKDGNRWNPRIVGPTLEVGLDGETQGNATLTEIEQTMINTLSKWPATAPCFMIVCLGDGYPTRDPCGKAAQIVRDLQNSKWHDPTQGGRNLRFLRPCDVAATYKAWQANPH